MKRREEKKNQNIKKGVNEAQKKHKEKLKQRIVNIKSFCRSASSIYVELQLNKFYTYLTCNVSII